MYIYQIYKTKKAINEAISTAKLGPDYIFSYNGSLYKMINSLKYKRMTEITYVNNCEKQRIERMCSLVYQPGDSIFIAKERTIND